MTDRKLHIILEPSMLKKLIEVSNQGFNGNLSAYVRIALLNDLLHRKIITEGEHQILKERT